jgi:hypothetical protein
MGCIVRTLDMELDETLTEAFHNPHLYPYSSSLSETHLHPISCGDMTPFRTRRALYMVEVFDRGRACWVVVIAVLLAHLSGFIAGIACRSANVGLAVSSSVSAWLSWVEALFVWQYLSRVCLRYGSVKDPNRTAKYHHGRLPDK